MFNITMTVSSDDGTTITRSVRVLSPSAVMGAIPPSQVFIKAAEKMGKEIRDMLAVTEPDPDD